MTSTPTRSRRLAVSAIAVMALGAATLGPAATASAESMPSSYATLTKKSQTSRETTFILSGRFGAWNLQHAQQLMQKKPYVVLRGDDYGSDEQLTDLDWLDWMSPNSNGAHFAKTFTVSTSSLNEDWGNDEVYAHVHLNTGGDNWRQIKSNNVNGDF